MNNAENQSPSSSMGFCIQICFSSKLLAAGRFAGINVSLVLIVWFGGAVQCTSD